MREPVISERPDSLPSETVRMQTGCGGLYITTSIDPNCFEMWPTLGKVGCCQRAFLEGDWRLTTVARRQLAPVARKLIISARYGIRCSTDPAHRSCPQAMADYQIRLWGFSDLPPETWIWRGPATFPPIKTACGEIALNGQINCRQAFLRSQVQLLYACRLEPNPIPQQLIEKCLEGILCEMSGPYVDSCQVAIMKALKNDWTLLAWPDEETQTETPPDRIVGDQ